ncbi:MAG: HD-GYP domain-containing protein [Candidatus Omnitrophica bacterium]|nr:HD-GYP domain-containing protein [Candidatus Omnitrophota bacterium]
MSNSLKIDFKKELETASRGMIMIHEPELLIKLIIRMIVRKLTIRHAAMIIGQPHNNTFVLKISRGESGMRIPQGFARFSISSPIVQIFSQKEYKSIILRRNALLLEDINKLIWQESVLENGNGAKFKELLHKVEDQMKTLNSTACVPAFYKDELMAILLLGEKKDGRSFVQDELDFFSALASDAAMAIRNAQLFDELKKEADRNRKLFLQTIMVLGSTIEAKDAYTHGHTERVTRYAVAIARHMADTGMTEFSESFFENLYIAGLLHDIGKIGVPEAILNKTGALKPEEYAIMQEHTVKGVEIVRPLNLPQECLDGILYHHEAFDGSGYPEGLSGANIPISASIIAVADAFDAMTSDRPYRKGLSKEVAIEEIHRKTGTQFNPIPAKAMMELYEMGKV